VSAPSLWQLMCAGALPPGIYELMRMPDFTEAVGGASVKVFTLVTDGSVNRESLLQALAQGLEFPDYFGNNWDAAFDCLTDRDWTPGSRVVLILDLRHNAAVDYATLQQFSSLVEDSARFWELRGVALYALCIS